VNAASLANTESGAMYIPTARSARKTAAGAFADLASGHWAAEAAGRLKYFGVVEGSDSNFNPDDDVTRIEFLKMLVLAMSVSNPAPQAPSMPGELVDEWHETYLKSAVDRGILSSSERSDVGMYPAAYITREEFCLWLGRAFTECQLVDGMYINAFPDGSFRPNAFVTRGYAAQALSNLLLR
jgi:hypothetical protein